MLEWVDASADQVTNHPRLDSGSVWLLMIDLRVIYGPHQFGSLVNFRNAPALGSNIYTDELNKRRRDRHTKPLLASYIHFELFCSDLKQRRATMPPPMLRGLSIDLPEDLIREEILLRLPAKSLLRFRSVCKSWHASISSLDFIYNHYHHQSNNKQRHIIYRWRRVENKTKSCFSVFSSNLERPEKPDYLELPGHAFYIYGPCNGIFCIYVLNWSPDSRGKWLALWNPATRRLMPLPFTADRKDINQLPRFMRTHCFACGFGMDPFTHELKIVILGHGCHSDQFAVYKSSNKIPWMFKSSDKLRVEWEGYSLEDKNVVFVNGFIYWIRLGYLPPNSVILAFDLHNEVFEVIQRCLR